MQPRLVLQLLESIARQQFLFRYDPDADVWEVVQRRGRGMAKLGTFAEWDHADLFCEALIHRWVARALRKLNSPDVEKLFAWRATAGPATVPPGGRRREPEGLPAGCASEGLPAVDTQLYGTSR